MLQSLILAKEEDIERSKEICKELENRKIEGKRRNELLAELEGLTGKVLREINDEILHDLNNLGPLFWGKLVKTFNEGYETEIENLELPTRHGWGTTVIDGKRVMYDPLKDESEREYRPIPKIRVEKFRTVYVVESNRQQVWKIKELIETFWKRVKGELRHTSIDKILDEKRRVEYEIAKVDRGQMKKENFSEFEYGESEWIRKPRPQGLKVADAGPGFRI